MSSDLNTGCFPDNNGGIIISEEATFELLGVLRRENFLEHNCVHCEEPDADHPYLYFARGGIACFFVCDYCMETEEWVESVRVKSVKSFEDLQKGEMQ